MNVDVMNVDVIYLNGSLRYECSHFSFIKSFAINVVVNGSKKFDFKNTEQSFINSVKSLVARLLLLLTFHLGRRNPNWFVDSK